MIATRTWRGLRGALIWGVAACWIFTASAAVAGENDAALADAARAHAAGDYVEARRIYGVLMLREDPHAQLALADMLLAGQGGPADPHGGIALLIHLGLQEFPAALPRLQSLADIGAPGAIFGLGQLHAAGALLPWDDRAAIEYYRRAADADDADAQLALAQRYDRGVGVPQDYAKAKTYYEQAARNGSARAFVGLGELFRSGKGVDVDADVAFGLFGIAAKSGDPVGQISLSSAYASGVGVDVDFRDALVWALRAEAGGVEQASSYVKALIEYLSEDDLLAVEERLKEGLSAPLK